MDDSHACLMRRRHRGDAVRQSTLVNDVGFTLGYGFLMPRTPRPSPRELSVDWPVAPADDPVGEVARRFAVNLAEAIAGMPQRTVTELTGVDHSTISRVLSGQAWPDLATIARLELGLKKGLWPRQLRK